MLPTRRGLMRCLPFSATSLPACDVQGRSMPSEGAAARGQEPLRKFFADLRVLERRQRRAPVVILQIGDSHTANDAFSTAMRDALQARFGRGGRGFLPPGIPFRTYNPAQVSVSAGQDWRAASSADRSAPGPFGITGLRQRAISPGAEIRFEGEPGTFARTELEILRQPGGGRLRAEFDGTAATMIATSDGERRAAFVALPPARQARRLKLTALGPGPVELLGVNLGRAEPGVVYANLGTIGATVELTARWDPATVTMEMAHLKPSLLAIAFGTNEGFNPGTAIADYERLFTAQVRMLAAAAPTAAVLVLGPPDGGLPRGRAPEAVSAACEGGIVAPPYLRAVRDAQRRAAAREGWYFWDWSAAMGGECSMARWVLETPPLALADHVHLRSAGYQRTAAELAREILAHYARWARSGSR